MAHYPGALMGLPDPGSGASVTGCGISDRDPQCLPCVNVTAIVNLLWNKFQPCSMLGCEQSQLLPRPSWALGQERILGDSIQDGA